MRSLGRMLVLVLPLAAGVASAQEGRGWFGADTVDVTKAEVDKLGWDAPHGARLGVVASGSPAEKAGLKTGDIIDLADGVEVETSSAFEKSVIAKPPGAEMRLRVLSGGRERRVAVILAERPKAQAAQDQSPPLLMLDTGGHMALIKGLAFTPNGEQLVSAGDDKLIRVWDWRAGKTVRTLRGWVGPGSEGYIYAMALSPDGRWLAVGGFLGPGRGVRAEELGRIRLYDFATGKLLALLTGHDNVVGTLAFSSDGKRLISGSHDNSAIIWDVEARKSMHRLRGHRNALYAVAFMPDGDRAVTASDDATLRLWQVGGDGGSVEMTGHKERVRALAVRSSDGTIASGDAAGEIRLWDGRSGAYQRTLGTQASGVGVLRFSPDGGRLLSTCRYQACPEIVWDVANGNRLLQARHHDNLVIAADITPDGRLAATAGGNRKEIRLWELTTAEPFAGAGGKPLTLMGTGASTFATAFSTDGLRIAWGVSRYDSRHRNPNDRGPLEWQLHLAVGAHGLGRPEHVSAVTGGTNSFVRSRTKFGAYTIKVRTGGEYGYGAILDLKKDDKLIAAIERGSTNGYRHSAYTFTPDGETIISAGSNGFITAYDLNGRRLGDFIGHEGAVRTVTPSPDGRLLVSGSDDQTVRLWNLKTRELIVTLFRGTDGEWVMWTPQGYYTGSPGADKIVGWQINRGAEQVPDYVGADQLRRHLNRPDIVEKAIILASAEQAVRGSPGTTFTLADLLARPVPRFKILSPLATEVQHVGRATIKIAIASTPDPIKAIRVQVNGRQVEEDTPDIGSGGFAPGERFLDVPLGRGRNEVRITLTNEIGEKAGVLTLNHKGEGALDKRGTLYILAIGVDKYAALGKTCGDNGKESCDLRFSGADARALVAAVEQRLGPAHTRIVKRVLINGAGANDEPTVINILDAIDTLKQANETDTVLLFIAGHGSNDGPDYRFLATNAERLGDTFRGATVVPWQILQSAVEGAKGRRILFIDTCHSGNAYNQQLGNAAYHANIIAYTAARFDQEALEDPRLSHGLFTYAVVEGLEGKGELAAKQQISTKDLASYVVRRVDELAKTQNAEQEPQYFKGRDAEDYVLARR